jgi:hypothetical protein
MRIAVATFLALTILSAEAHAGSSFADLLFGKNPTWDQHVDDEAFGDEFERK